MTEADSALPTGPRVADLPDVLRRPGPFATVVIGYESAAEDAAETRRLRWLPMRDQLLDLGASTHAVDAVEVEARREPGGHRAALIVADDDGVQLVARHLEDPKVEVARWSLLPSLLPAVEWRQLTPPHVVVLVDRTGADIHVATPEGSSVALPVEGTHDELRKVHAGGWSSRRFQQRAEDSWEHNAGEVASTVTRFARAADAEAIIVAGDPHAVPLVLNDLGADVAPLAHSLPDGSRDAGLDAMGTDVLHLVATVAAEGTVAFLQRWREESGRGARATSGAAATIEALREASVGVLGIHDDPDDERDAWFGPSPEHIALEPATLHDLGVDEPARARLRDALVRSALLTGADVRVIPHHGGPAEGIGAILRWTA